jgi:plastocyanin
LRPGTTGDIFVRLLENEETKFMKKTFALIIVAGLASSLQLACAGDISGKITLKGTPPKEKEITPLKEDPNCGKLHPEVPTTHFYVVDSDGGLADVVVSLQGQGLSGKSTGASAPPAIVDQKGCEYKPSILAVQTDQKIVVKNSDPVMHNVHPQPAVPGNKEDNKAQMPNGPDLTFTFPKPENFLKVVCNVHPWMFAWITVVDHPYFAVSAKDGTFKIANVPAGKYTLQAVHRKAGKVTQEIEVKEGEAAKVDLTLEAK